MKRIALKLILVCLFIAGVYNITSAQYSRKDSILFTADFFEKTEPVEITLEFNIKKLNKEKSDEEYFPGKIRYYNAHNNLIEKDISIKARGEFRRKKCYFAPYWLNFSKARMKDDYFKGIKKIKVVTQCKSSSAYNDYLIKEYLAYRMYNIITENSFKVRLLKINYIDTGRNKRQKKKFAFMIEPEELVADRLEAYPLELDKVKNKHTDSTATTVMNVFQLMIGNTDFSIPGRHNIKLFTPKDFKSKELIPVAYDFDFSGLVNAEYASPHPTFDIDKVTERYYYGICRSDELYQEVIDLFKEKKEEIFNLINSFEHINNRNRKYVLNYIEEFYMELEEPEFIEKRIRSTCTEVNK